MNIFQIYINLFIKLKGMYAKLKKGACILYVKKTFTINVCTR